MPEWGRGACVGMSLGGVPVWEEGVSVGRGVPVESSGVPE